MDVRTPRARRRVSLLACLAPLLGCAGPGATAPQGTPTAVSLTPVPAGGASAGIAPPRTAEPKPADLGSPWCAGAGVCVVRRERAAGLDAAGGRLRVLSVYRGVETRDPDSVPPAPAGGELDLGIEETDTQDTTAPVLGYMACHRFEYWLLTEVAGSAPRAERLFTLCNDGYGAAGMGEDTVVFGDNKLVLTTSGGSNWRGSRTKEISLSPLRIRAETGSNYWVLGNNRELLTWDAATLSGFVSWYSPRCQADGTAPDADDPAGQEGAPGLAYVPIPALDFGGDFAAAGWKTVGLEGCSLAVDATGRGGFVSFGKPGVAGDGSMRVVASRANELFVEVNDDQWVGPTASWVKDDHLELWLAPELPNYFAHCLDGSLPGPSQWGIRVADGQVFAGAGKPDPKALSAERVAVSGGAVRLKLTLPPGMAAVSLVYSDSDDGKRQERLLATSQLVHGKVETLGALRPLEPAQAVCRVEGGRLTLSRPPHSGETAILDLR